MDLVVENELPRQSVCANGGCFGLGGLGRRDIKYRPKHIVQRDKGGRHTATGTEEMPAVHPQSTSADTGKLLQTLLKLPLALCLRQRVEFPVRHDPGRHRRSKRDRFRRLGLRQFTLAQKNRHTAPPLVLAPDSQLLSSELKRYSSRPDEGSRRWLMHPHRSHGTSGFSQRIPGNRAKSPSVEHRVSPCSIARAARCASGTKLP